MTFSSSATAAATATTTTALIQSTKNLSITSIETSSSTLTSTSSSTLLSSYSSELLEVQKKPEGPRKKIAFRPSKRQQRREKTATPTTSLSLHQLQEPSSSFNSSDVKERHPSVCIPARQDFMYNPNAWSNLSSTVWKSDRTMEMVLEWDEAIGQEHHQLVEIARLAVEKTEDWFEDGNGTTGNTTSRMFRMLNLASSMRCFVKHCRSNLTDVRSYKLKLVAMHGPKATRCPAWHTDNVPLRWIQTYAGVGCVYLHEEAHQNNDNDDDDDDGTGFNTTSSRHEHEHKDINININININTTIGNVTFDPLLQRVRENDHDKEEKKHGHDWKNRLVELSGIPISQSPTGEPAILVGRMWPSWSIEQQQQQQQHLDSPAPLRGPMAGVLHRSPRNNPVNQARVLLNLDVVCHHDHQKSISMARAGRTVPIVPSAPDETTKKKESWFQRRNKKKTIQKAIVGGSDLACSPQQKLYALSPTKHSSNRRNVILRTARLGSDVGFFLRLRLRLRGMHCSALYATRGNIGTPKDARILAGRAHRMDVHFDRDRCFIW